jgi:hypothetical protein
VPLDDALAILVLLRDDERRFDRAVVRWHARFCLEVRGVGPDEAQLALAALRAWRGPTSRPGRPPWSRCVSAMGGGGRGAAASAR